MRDPISTYPSDRMIALSCPHSFGVNIIPFTWQHTNLCALRAGDAVNLETDYIGKYVLQYMRRQGSVAGSVSMRSLRDAGFAVGQDLE